MRWIATLLLACCEVQAQVHVEVRTHQNSYLAGEPIFVIVEVENVGLSPIEYLPCFGETAMEVVNGRKRHYPRLGSCRGDAVEHSGCGVYHPPLLLPRKKTSFSYLLKGYNLLPGSYDLRVRGTASVKSQSGLPPPFGAEINAILLLQIETSTELELKHRLESYVKDASAGQYTYEGYRAQEAIAEMAPPFLRKEIRWFSDNDQGSRLAVKGLTQIDTAESRQDLIDLFNESPSAQIRLAVIEGLAAIATRDEFEFLNEVLFNVGEDAESDAIKVAAARGIGHIGGDRAIETLHRAGEIAPPAVKQSIPCALEAAQQQITH